MSRMTSSENSVRTRKRPEERREEILETATAIALDDGLERITLRARTNKRRVEILVEDNGIGFEPAEKRDLFEGFVRGKAALERRRDAQGWDANDTMAIGDGANDRPMVEAAGLGIAYRAKPVLAEAADVRLDHHGLDALLWGFGVPSRDWVSVD